MLLVEHHSVCCEFIVHESTIWYFQRKEQEAHQSIQDATPSAKVKSTECSESVEEVE